MDSLCPWLYLCFLCFNRHPFHSEGAIYDKADDPFYSGGNFARFLFYSRAKGLARVQVLGLNSWRSNH